MTFWAQRLINRSASMVGTEIKKFRKLEICSFGHIVKSSIPLQLTAEQSVPKCVSI